MQPQTKLHLIKPVRSLGGVEILSVLRGSFFYSQAQSVTKSNSYQRRKQTAVLLGLVFEII